MSGPKSSAGASSVLPLVVIGAEHSDDYGRLHSPSGLRLMRQAAIAAATAELGLPFMALSTERVTFFEPVPLGHSVAFQAEIDTLPNARFRVQIEGLARLQGAGNARCVMTGSFILVAVDTLGRPMAAQAMLADLRVA
jgi:acyl-CoA hydrolase